MNIKKVQVFADYFREIYSTHPLNQDNDMNELIKNKLEQAKMLLLERIFIFDNDNSALSPIAPQMFTSIAEVTSIIKNLNSKKSAGPDNISNFILKKISKIAIESLTIIINNCLNNGYFPLDWKVARLFPVQKKSHCFELSNFRPIYLCCPTQAKF